MEPFYIVIFRKSWTISKCINTYVLVKSALTIVKYFGILKLELNIFYHAKDLIYMSSNSAFFYLKFISFQWHESGKFIHFISIFQYKHCFYDFQRQYFQGSFIFMVKYIFCEYKYPLLCILTLVIYSQFLIDME